MAGIFSNFSIHDVRVGGESMFNGSSALGSSSGLSSESLVFPFRRTARVRGE